MDINQFDYELPESLIAQSPLAERTQSRLMTLDRGTGKIGHHVFEDLEQFLQPGDTLVLNDTKVIPARLTGVKEGTGAAVELLLLRSLGSDRWDVLAKPARRLKAGTVIHFSHLPLPHGDGGCTGDASATAPLLTAVVEEEQAMGGRVVRFQYDGIFQEILDRLGAMPLPPYIKEQLSDASRYQTVYARHEGSAAAPTAGLHFTSSYLERLACRGIHLAYITLHVGLGTFRPVSVDRIEEHEMHAEFYRVSNDAAARIAATRAAGGRVVAVGTTVARTLETVAARYEGEIRECEGWTDIFIYPGHSFRAIDGLLTNFHLPKSTLIMLVSALAGTEEAMTAYRTAVEHRYRFFSFGDAMLIL